MSRGLFLKTLREVGAMTVLLALALMGVEAILAYVLPSFYDELPVQLFQIKFVQTMLKALLGTDVGGMLNPTILSAIAWVHPVVLAIVWAHAIVFFTRIPVGEVDRGTIDVLLGLPVSRWRVYRCELVVFMLCGVFLLLMGSLGNRLGSLLVTADRRSDAARLAVVVINLFCLYVAVGALAGLVSSLNTRRGRAVAIVVAILVASFLVKFLAQLWEPAQSAAVLSLLNYYEPLVLLREEGWPVADMAVLTGFATVTWIAGGVCFARRDICTV